MALNNRNLFSHTSGSYKSQIKVLAGPCFLGSLLGEVAPGVPWLAATALGSLPPLHDVLQLVCRCLHVVFPLLIRIPVFLAGVTQWIECCPVNQRVAGSIPSQGTCLGCGPTPPLEGCTGSNNTLMSLSLSPSLPLSKNK